MCYVLLHVYFIIILNFIGHIRKDKRMSDIIQLALFDFIYTHEDIIWITLNSW